MIETFASSDAQADAAARAVEQQLIEGLSDRGRASLVGTGGSSPGPVYDRLSRADLDWAHVAVTLSDERHVDANSPNSNARLVRERLLVDRAAAAQFLPLTDYAEGVLRKLMPFDAVMLGMGPDGHIASLIPGSPVLSQGMDPDGEALTAESPQGFGAPPVARITLTLSALLQSRAIFLLIAGEAKRQVVEQAQGGADYPVRAILNQDRVPVRIFWTAG
ncbi:MAG TPA: 6-phosphogluconolactonase [Phenylobacterium sp.]|uniref:6-phosphogluconolactonase n=1 Tax=Phenylobacterium sp. TaxID=1871053 RepID=UPI002D6DCA8E|nr:6-phosphogluconolactonase [Phenylobacterium sp.]HZZ68446.1 6-phosphogluconolactonase [Phenylobacterium sp.]